MKLGHLSTDRTEPAISFQVKGADFVGSLYWKVKQNKDKSISLTIFMSSAVHLQKQPPELFCKKSVLKNFANFVGKHLCWSLFLRKLHTFRPATLLERVKLEHF